METLKKILSKITILFIIGLITSFSALSQDTKALQKAFEDSYNYETKGEYSKAIDGLKKVYDEKSYETNLRLGWLFYMSGLFTESAPYYQKAINLKPYSIEARLGSVYPASALGNWEQVKKQYFEIIKIDPQNSLVNYRMGLIYYGKEDYTKAKTYFEKVINLYPFDYDSIIMYAWTNYKLKNFREAKILFNKALLMKPNDESATQGLELIK